MRAPAFLTRSGVFVYHRADGSEVREYRSAEEVFHADSLASLSAAPVTRLHPSRPVDAKSFRSVVVGHVGDEVKQDGDKVAATVHVQDADAIAAVEAGMRQVSCGYTCDIEETAGVTESGERYDRAQRSIRYNHVALVPVGRAGSEVALRLDAAGNSITEETNMEIRTDADKVVEENGALKAENARLDAEVVALKSELAALPAKMKARASLEARAVKLIGAEFKADGLSDDQIKDAMVEAAEKRADSAPVVAEAAPVKVSKVEAKADGSDRDARAEMLARNRNAWKGATV